MVNSNRGTAMLPPITESFWVQSNMWFHFKKSTVKKSKKDWNYDESYMLKSLLILHLKILSNDCYTEQGLQS